MIAQGTAIDPFTRSPMMILDGIVKGENLLVGREHQRRSPLSAKALVEFQSKKTLGQISLFCKVTRV